MGDDVKAEEAAPSPVTYSEIFHKAFPQYLMMGMSAAEFWDGDSELVKDYREAYRLQCQSRARMMDEAAWLQGRYMRDALQSVYLLVNGFVPKQAQAAEYPSLPYLQKEEENRKKESREKQKENQQKTSMAYMQMFVEKFNKNFLRRKEREQQQEKTQDKKQAGK